MIAPVLGSTNVRLTRAADKVNPNKSRILFFEYGHQQAHGRSGMIMSTKSTLAPDEHDELKLAGVLPAQQSRSRALRDRLIVEGLRLARTRSFDEVSIADLCGAAGCSIGAFYARFPDKITLFRAVMISAAAGSGPAMEAVVENEPFENIIPALVVAQVKRFRENEIFFRTAFKISLEDRDSWEPFRRNSHALADAYLARMRQQPHLEVTQPLEDRVRFAFQLMYGVLNNTILNRPGPFFLENPAFARHLQDSIIATIGIAQA
jgi:AcrR family transcriptional regulator